MIPNPGSLVLQRRLRIAEVIRRQGSMRVEALSEMLGVSAVTVRAGKRSRRSGTDRSSGVCTIPVTRRRCVCSSSRGMLPWLRT